MTVADRLNDDRVLLTKWVRRLTNWNGRQAPLAAVDKKSLPLLEQKLAEQKTPVGSLGRDEPRASSPSSASPT